MFFIIISVVHVSGGVSAHHQELIKLYVLPWVLSCFPVVYRWCGWVVTDGFSAHHQELIKLYVLPWVLSCFPAVYRWCGCVGTHPHQR